MNSVCPPLARPNAELAMAIASATAVAPADLWIFIASVPFVGGGGRTVEDSMPPGRRGYAPPSANFLYAGSAAWVCRAPSPAGRQRQAELRETQRRDADDKNDRVGISSSGSKPQRRAGV